MPGRRKSYLCDDLAARWVAKSSHRASPTAQAAKVAQAAVGFAAATASRTTCALAGVPGSTPYSPYGVT